MFIAKAITNKAKVNKTNIRQTSRKKKIQPYPSKRRRSSASSYNSSQGNPLNENDEDESFNANQRELEEKIFGKSSLFQRSSRGNSSLHNFKRSATLKSFKSSISSKSSFMKQKQKPVLIQKFQARKEKFRKITKDIAVNYNGSNADDKCLNVHTDIIHSKSIWTDCASLAEIDTNDNSNKNPNIRLLDYDLDVDDDSVHLVDGFIHPASSRKLKWDVFIGFLIVYSILLVPYRIGFDIKSDGWVKIFDLIVDICFALDMCLQFRTGFVNIDGEIVFEFKEVAKRYFATSFTVDFFSTFPFEVISTFIEVGNTNYIRATKLLRVLRIAKLMRLFKSFKFSKLLGDEDSDVGVNTNFLSLIKMFVQLCILAHLLGCFWHWLLYFSDKDDPDSVNWYNSSPYEETDDVGYALSIYWAFTTMTTVGFGDINPYSDVERFFCLFAMLIGASVFGFVIGNVTVMMENFDMQSTLHREKMDRIKEYIRDRKFPKVLGTRIRQHFKYFYHNVTVFDTTEIMQALPASLAARVVFIQNKSMISSIPFLSDQPCIFVAKLVPLLKPFQMDNQDILFYEGEIATCFYVCQTGKLEARFRNPHAEDKNSLVFYETFKDGSLIGDISIMLNIMRPYTVISQKACEMLFIDKSDFFMIIDYWPDINEIFLEKSRKTYSNITNFKKKRNKKTVIDLFSDEIKKAEEESKSKQYNQNDERAYNPLIDIGREIERASLIKDNKGPKEESKEKDVNIDENNNSNEKELVDDGNPLLSPNSRIQKLPSLASPKVAEHLAVSSGLLPKPDGIMNPDVRRATKIVMEIEKEKKTEGGSLWQSKFKNIRNQNGQALLPLTKEAEKKKQISEKYKIWDQKYIEILKQNESNKSGAFLDNRNTAIGDGEQALTPKKLWAQSKIIHPEALIKTVWDLLICILILYSVINVTFRLGFDHPATGGAYNFDLYFVDTSFYLDIILTFNTAIWTKNGSLTTTRGGIAKNYLGGWFVLDFFSTISIDQMFGDGTPGLKSTKLLKAIRLIRLVKISRMFKMSGMFSKYEDKISVNPALVKVLRLFVFMGFVGHLDACAWYAVGLINGETSWINDYCLWNGKCLSEMPVRTKYIASLYWSFTTMTTIGYGDITPNLSQQNEIITAMISQVLGTTIFAYVIGAVVNLVLNLDPGDRMRKQQTAFLTDYLKTLLNPLENNGHSADVKHLQKIMRNNNEHIYNIRSVFPEEIILQDLPPHLRIPVTIYLFRNALPKLPLLAKVELKYSGFLPLILPKLKPVLYMRNEYIMNPSAPTREMFFITRGRVKSYPCGAGSGDSAENSIHLRRSEHNYSTGDYLGAETIIIPEHLPFLLLKQAKAITQTELFALSKQDYNQLKILYPFITRYLEREILKATETLAQWVFIPLKYRKEFVREIADDYNNNEIEEKLEGAEALNKVDKSFKQERNKPKISPKGTSIPMAAKMKNLKKKPQKNFKF